MVGNYTETVSVLSTVSKKFETAVDLYTQANEYLDRSQIVFDIGNNSKVHKINLWCPTGMSAGAITVSVLL